jgi:uncharacterized membrane protein YraQ (UPF0718 family)
VNDVGFVYLITIALAYLGAFRADAGRARRSLQAAGRSLRGLIPLLLAVFGLVGLFQVFLPPALIERWLGSASGTAALFAGGLLGAVAIGPPAAAFPLAGSLLQAGAWAPAVAAFIVSWLLVGIVTLPFEASVFGPRFALARNGLCLAASLAIGLLIGALL